MHKNERKRKTEALNVSQTFSFEDDRVMAMLYQYESNSNLINTWKKNKKRKLNIFSKKKSIKMTFQASFKIYFSKLLIYVYKYNYFIKI